MRVEDPIIAAANNTYSLQRTAGPRPRRRRRQRPRTVADVNDNVVCLRLHASPAALLLSLPTIEHAMAFPVGALVWARVAGHPRWPGQVSQASLTSPAASAARRASDTHLVRFFGDGTCGRFPERELEAFESGLKKHAHAAKTAAFRKAVADAKATADAGAPYPGAWIDLSWA